MLVVSEVKTRFDERLFNELPKKLNVDSPAWYPPLENDINSIFDPKQNDYYKYGECKRFLVFEGSRVTARFALMNHLQHDSVFSPKLAGIGFIELENNPEIMNAIIAFAKDWHQTRGYQGMRGPINFGINTNYWGVLIDNFKQMPVYAMPYNPSYYNKLYELSGAIKLHDHYTYESNVCDDLPSNIQTIGERFIDHEDVVCRTINIKHLESDIDAIYHIYKTAWQNQAGRKGGGHYLELSKEALLKAAKKMQPFLQESANTLVFVKGQPASFAVITPDLSDLSRQLNGKAHWWNLLKILRFKNYATRARALVFGTAPEYRRLGLEVLQRIILFRNLRKNYPKTKTIYASWIQDDNWLMQRSAESLGFSKTQTHRTYRWDFQE